MCKGVQEEEADISTWTVLYDHIYAIFLRLPDVEIEPGTHISRVLSLCVRNEKGCTGLVTRCHHWPIYVYNTSQNLPFIHRSKTQPSIDTKAIPQIVTQSVNSDANMILLACPVATGMP